MGRTVRAVVACAVLAGALAVPGRHSRHRTCAAAAARTKASKKRSTARANGATLKIAPGTYVENVVVNKPVTLIGSSGHGGRAGHVEPRLRTGLALRRGGQQRVPGRSRQRDDLEAEGRGRQPGAHQRRGGRRQGHRRPQRHHHQPHGRHVPEPPRHQGHGRRRLPARHLRLVGRQLRRSTKNTVDNVQGEAPRSRCSRSKAPA